MTKSEAPEWIVDAVQQARRFFCIGGAEWHINIHMTDKPGYSKTNNGSADTNSRYLNSTIEFNHDLEPDSRGRACVLHEIGHVAMYEIDDVIQRIIEQVPEDRQEFLRNLLDEVEERFLQRLSRGLVYELGLGVEESNE